MADIVDRSGASIGSIYHHFGGKKELFLAIYERLSADVEQRIAEAARGAAGLDSRQAFGVHARAYLDAIWQNRRAAMMIASGDVPAGFEESAAGTHSSSFTGGWASSTWTRQIGAGCYPAS